MKRIAIVRDNCIVNIVFSNEDNFVPEPGFDAIDATDGMNIGSVYVDGFWVDTRAPWLINENEAAPYPEDGKAYTWNEESKSWVLLATNPS